MIEKIMDKLYEINTWLSSKTFIHKERLTLKDQEGINKELGVIIKEIREQLLKGLCNED